MSGGILQSGFRPPLGAAGVPLGVQPGFGAATTFGAPVQNISTRGILTGGAGQVGGFSSFIGGNAFGDVDPISPGIQTQPGVLTATGPTTVIAGGAGGLGGIAGGVDINRFRTNGGFGSFNGGVIGGGVGGAVIDADPITPGIQAQPGVVTAVGPPKVIGGPGFNGAVRTSYGGIGGVQTSGIAGFNQGFAGGVGVGGVATGGFVGGVGAVGGMQTSSFNRSVGFGGVVDADPFTPGIQAQPGIVTATGPSTVVGHTGGVNVSGIRTGGIIDADPFTPGIQAQPGILTTTGVATGGMLSSGFNGGAFGAIVDADPFTPGIQAQPGTVTVTGPTTTVSTINQGGVLTSGVYGQQMQGSVMHGTIHNANILNSGVGYYQSGIAGGIDADPFTPGVQSGPGIVTQTGPSRVIGRVGGESWFSCCPWWVWPLLGLLLLAALIGGLYAALRPKSSSDSEDIDEDITTTITRKPKVIKDDNQTGELDNLNDKDNNNKGNETTTTTTTTTKNETTTTPVTPVPVPVPVTDKNDTTTEPATEKPDTTSNETKTTTVCKNGFLNAEGKCVTCPEGSTWDGKSCTYNTTKSTVDVTKVTVGAIDGDTPEGEELDTSIKISKNESESGSTAKTVPVFSKPEGQSEVTGVIKNNKQDEGTKPEIITSKPITMKPSVTVDAQGNVQTKESDVVSNNLVTVPAIVTKKSVPPTMVTRSLECKFSGAACLGNTPYLGYGNTGVYSISSKSSSSSSSSGSGSSSTTTGSGATESGSSTSTTTTTEGGDSSASKSQESGSSSGNGTGATTTETTNSSTGSDSESSSGSSGSSSSSGSSDSDSSSDNKTTTTTTKTTKTTQKEQTVDPIVVEPTVKHLRQRRM